MKTPRKKPKAIQTDAAVKAIGELIAQDKGRELVDFMASTNELGVEFGKLLLQWARSQDGSRMSWLNAEGVAAMMQGLLIANAKAHEVVAKSAPAPEPAAPQHIVGFDPASGQPLQGEILPPGRPVAGIDQALAVFESRRATKQ